ncbi:hypothetical protein [uncultured Enterococcus sp.]|uniref:hypothetical protein n=1 Tax=uncultured Enterococcus sp. TaxID=167972 RepID=UPI0026365C9F|nr:hypothetical protein [uncultured Enterococcus sp.]
MKKHLHIVIIILAGIAIFEFAILLFHFVRDDMDTKEQEAVRQEIVNDMNQKDLLTARMFRERGLPHGENVQIWQLSTKGKSNFIIQDSKHQIASEELSGIEALSIFEKVENQQLEENTNFDKKVFHFLYNQLKADKQTACYKFEHHDINRYYLVNPSMQFGLLIRINY